MMSKKIGFGVVAAVVGSVVAGCGTAGQLSASHIGGGAAHLSRANFTRAVGQATKGARSVHLEMDSKVGGSPLAMSVDMALDSGSVMNTFTNADMLGHLSMKLTVTGATGSVEMRLVKGKGYLYSTLGVPSGDAVNWIGFDATDPSSPFAKMFADHQRIDISDLATSLVGITGVANLGQKIHDGEATVHYRVTIDTAQAARLMGGTLDARAQALPATVTSDVWVDDESRPVEITSDAGGTETAMRFSHWGESIDVQAPDPAHVIPYQDPAV